MCVVYHCIPRLSGIKFIPCIYSCGRFKKKKGRDSQNCRPSIGSINPKIFFLRGDRGTGLRSPPSGVYLWDRTSPRLAVLEAVHGGRGVFDWLPGWSLTHERVVDLRRLHTYDFPRATYTGRFLVRKRRSRLAGFAAGMVSPRHYRENVSKTNDDVWKTQITRENYSKIKKIRIFQKYNLANPIYPSSNPLNQLGEISTSLMCNKESHVYQLQFFQITNTSSCTNKYKYSSKNTKDRHWRISHPFRHNATCFTTASTNPFAKRIANEESNVRSIRWYFPNYFFHS